MPEFLEYRYNKLARSIMALLTVIIYVVVLLAAVLYSGGLTLRTIFGLPLHYGVWLIGIIAALYTSWGGLKAVAWADLFQGGALLVGGIVTFFLGLAACGGWESFTTENADKLHMILESTHEGLPWTGVVSGMWIVIIYYCGLNQFIVQRNLAAKTMRDGQLGVIFAGALWLIVPFAIVMPGIMAVQLYGEQMAKPDEAFPTLIKSLIPMGIRGFMFAAIAGAVTSSLASMLNSASTVFTMDVYHQLLNKEASQQKLVRLGRMMTILFVVIGCTIAPALDNEKFGGVFQYIQQFQGYIWPGVVGAFALGFILKRAPGSAGVAALLSGPAIYWLLQQYTHIHFLIQVLIAFLGVALIMTIITFVAPLDKPRELPIREDMDVKTEPIVKIIGALVILGVAAFYIIFW